MGASVIGYWPGITDEQLESQPGFDNDCKAWGDWMAEREKHPNVIALLRSLGVGALLSHTTDGMDPSLVEWVKPLELGEAARRLRDLVRTNDPRVRPILQTYARRAKGVDPVEQEFAADLHTSPPSRTMPGRKA